MFSLGLLDHTDLIQPNGKMRIVFLFFFLLVECFQIFPCHLCTHYESSWVRTNSYNSVLRCWVSVTHSLAIVWITWLPIWIAQGHSFLRSDLAIQIPTQCCNSFSSDLERACQRRIGIIQSEPVQKIMLYRQNVKIWNALLDFYLC